MKGAGNPSRGASLEDTAGENPAEQEMLKKLLNRSFSPNKKRAPYTSKLSKVQSPNLLQKKKRSTSKKKKKGDVVQHELPLQNALSDQLGNLHEMEPRIESGRLEENRSANKEI